MNECFIQITGSQFHDEVVERADRSHTSLRANKETILSFFRGSRLIGFAKQNRYFKRFC